MSLIFCPAYVLAIGLMAVYGSGVAFAHATLEKAVTPAGASYRAAIKIGHGCNGSATTAVRVRIPEGVIAVKPMPKAGWTISTEKGPYLKPYAAHHGTVDSGVKEIVWTGGPLSDDHYDEFIFSSYVTNGFAPGDTLYFPVIQTCVEGNNQWVQVPAPGQNIRDLKEPAPLLRITAGDNQTSAARVAYGPTITEHGSLKIDSPWLRATPGGAKVAAGYVVIINSGKESDRLLGAVIPGASRGEVHGQSARDGVMVMRVLSGGMEIPADGRLKLAPGGDHLMFQNLESALREGESIQGNLLFEKAGSVPVTFRAGGMGAATPEDHKH